jgi:hypothetical protein
MAVAPIALIPPSITITPEPGNFAVSNRPGAQGVTVNRVRGIGSLIFSAVMYRTPLNVDFDGAPDAYAPPVDHPPHGPLPGFAPRDHINNATDQVPPTFNANGVNTFLWAGIVPRAHAQPHVPIDNRLFLRDHLGRFPVQQANGFYVSKTATTTGVGVETDQAHWVNANTVPYGALGGLRSAGVDLGDFGLAIRASTGAHTGFVFADAGGRHSVSVGEYSANLRATLRNPGNEEVCFIVFPGSARAYFINSASG